MRASGVARPDPKLAATTRDAAIERWRAKAPPIPEEVISRVVRTYVGPEFLKRDEDFWNAVIEAEAQAFLRELAASLGPPRPKEPPKPAQPDDVFTANDPSPTQVGKPPPASEKPRVVRARRRAR